jgi:hypothetical protein
MSLEDLCARDEQELLRAVCLCSSVQVLPSGALLASSPDERALVQAAAARGVTLLSRQVRSSCLSTATTHNPLFVFRIGGHGDAGAGVGPARAASAACHAELCLAAAAHVRAGRARGRAVAVQQRSRRRGAAEMHATRR